MPPYADVAHKVTLLGASQSQLAQADLARLGCDYNDELEHVYAHANHGKNGPLDFAHGEAMVFRPEAPLRHDYLRQSMNGQIVLALIEGSAACDGTPLTCEYFERRLAALAAAVPDDSDQPPRASVIDADTGADREQWSCVLGRGSRLGVYRCRIGPNQYVFYLVALINETPCGYDAYRYAVECAETHKITLADFAEDRFAMSLARLARRNADRVLAAAAAALGVTVAVMRDISACDPVPNACKPRAAVAKVRNEFNMVRECRWRERDAVVIYDNCIDVGGAKNGVVFFLDARAGMWLMQGDRVGTQLFANEAANSFPFSDRMLSPATSASASKRGDSDRFSWHGRKAGTSHPALDAVGGRRQVDVAALLQPLCDGDKLELEPVIVHFSAP